MMVRSHDAVRDCVVGLASQFVWRAGCSRSHDAVIRVYDDAGNVIETHEHKGEFKEPSMLLLPSAFGALDASLLLRPFVEDGAHSLFTETQTESVFLRKLGDLFLLDLARLSAKSVPNPRRESCSASIGHASIVRFPSLACPLSQPTLRARLHSPFFVVVCASIVYIIR